MATKKLTKKQLTAQRIALQERNVERQSIIDAEAAAVNAVANQPYLEELPPKFEADIPAYLKAIETGRLAPGILKEGFTEGLVPEDIYKKLNMTSSPDVVGWRVVTNPDGTQQLEVQTGIGTSQTYGANIGGTVDTKSKISTEEKTLVSTTTDEYGNVVGIYSDGSTKILVPSGRKYKSTVDEDAYTLLESTFRDFGLEELVPEIKKFMERGLGSNQAAVELRKTQVYIDRFKGNEIRRASGLNVLSEAEYLALEDSYSQTLRAYGLQNYFGIDRKTKTAAMANIIGNDISALEFKDRIDTVVTRVNNADPTIKKTLNSFYNITDSDLVKYFLNPKENLPKLQEKVTAAEIGSAALGQGLITDVTAATALAQFGVTRQQALEGYGKIGETLPTTRKLSDIYAEEKIDYTQTTAEEEVFKGLASAERKRRQLAAREVASFGGASGVSKSAFGSATGGAF